MEQVLVFINLKSYCKEMKDLNRNKPVFRLLVAGAMDRPYMYNFDKSLTIIIN